MNKSNDVARATAKNVTFAVIDDPRYFDTELFMGKYIDTIIPITKARPMYIDVCITIPNLFLVSGL